MLSPLSVLILFVDTSAIFDSLSDPGISGNATSRTSMTEIYDLPDDDLIDLLMKRGAFGGRPAGTPIRCDGKNGLQTATNASGRHESAGKRTKLQVEEIASLDHLLSLARALAEERNNTAIPNPTVSQRIRSQIVAGQDPLGEHYSWLRSAEERREIGATLTPLKIVQSMVT